MIRFRQSLIPLVILTVLLSTITLVMPALTQGQGNSNNVPPAQNVNVVNTPDVSVVNGAANPLLVRDVDNAQQPFHITATMSLIGTSGRNETVFSVPEGKRLVIETVSAQSTVAPIDTVQTLAVLTRVQDAISTHFILALKQGLDLNGNNVFAATHYIRAYGDPGTNVQFQFAHSETSSHATAVVTISGYMVDVP